VVCHARPPITAIRAGDTDGNADRVRGISPAMAKRTELVGTLHQHLPDLVGDDDT